MRLDWGRQNREICYYMTKKYVAEEILLQTLLQRIWGCWGWQYPPRGLHHKSQTWYHNMGKKTNEKLHIFELTCPLMTNKQVCTFPHTCTHQPQHSKSHAMATSHKGTTPTFKHCTSFANLALNLTEEQAFISGCDPLFQEPPFLPLHFPDRLLASL